MLTVADIMTQPVVTLSPSQSLKDAHDITRERGIRHLPVVDDSNTLVGIVTQKSMIARVMHLLQLYGHEALPEHEASTRVTEVAVVDYQTVNANQPLTEVASFFLKNKHGCLPVVDEDNHVVGMLTSSDFVKLAADLLAKQG